MQEGLTLLNQVQRRWVYLEPIFGRGALPSQQARFRNVDEEFRRIMAHLEVGGVGAATKGNRSCISMGTDILYPVMCYSGCVAAGGSPICLSAGDV
jgi:hypothetical protein